jgi:hypothetical protein
MELTGEYGCVHVCRTKVALSNHSLAKQPHQRDQDDYDRQYEPFPFHGYSSPWLTNRQRQRSPLAARSSAGSRPTRLVLDRYKSYKSQRCSILLTLEFRLVIENHIQQ